MTNYIAMTGQSQKHRSWRITIFLRRHLPLITKWMRVHRLQPALPLATGESGVVVLKVLVLMRLTGTSESLSNDPFGSTPNFLDALWMPNGTLRKRGVKCSASWNSWSCSSYLLIIHRAILANYLTMIILYLHLRLSYWWRGDVLANLSIGSQGDFEAEFIMWN